MPDPEKIKLLFGPYVAPQTRPGKYLSCELRGKVRVYDFSDARIPWPIGANKRRPSIIVCGDLIRAVKYESLKAVCYHWGVCHQTVSNWRQMLGVERWTVGSLRLLSYSLREAMTLAVCRKISERRKGRAIRLSPEAHRSYVARLRQSWTPRRRRWMADRMRQKMRQLGGERLGVHPNAWKPEEDKLIGTRPDAEIGKLLGRSRFAVALRRHHLRIPSFLQPNSLRPWTAKEEKLLGTMPDKEAARLLHRSATSVQARRRVKGIAMLSPCRKPWSPAEDRLLGTKSDVEVAMMLGRSEAAVTARRYDLRISLQKPRFRPWTPNEEKLLGTQPDWKVAQLLGRTALAVTARRAALDIPAVSQVESPQPWTAREEKLLGKRADEEVARIIGRSALAVQQHRHLRGIANVAPKQRPWSPYELSLLGTQPDREIALVLERPVYTVNKKRRQLSIPNWERREIEQEATVKPLRRRQVIKPRLTSNRIREHVLAVVRNAS